MSWKKERLRMARALQAATEFNQRPLVFCRTAGAITQVMNRPGFIAPPQYGLGMLPLNCEIGYVDGKRYVTEGEVRW